MSSDDRRNQGWPFTETHKLSTVKQIIAQRDEAVAAFQECESWVASHDVPTTEEAQP